MSDPQPEAADRQPGEWVRVTGGPTVSNLWLWNGHDWSNLIIGGMTYVLRQQKEVIQNTIVIAQNEVWSL